jgi:hypothetical protein
MFVKLEQLCGVFFIIVTPINQTMEKISYAIDIQAPRDVVWKTLWNDVTYRKWTSVFSEGSYVEATWLKGSGVRFLTPEGNGMYSTIAELVPNEVMAFKHLGVIKGGVEQPADEETKKWQGAVEKYTLRENGGVTLLSVEMEAASEHKEYFEKTFPRALELVKELAEKESAQA